MPHTYSKVEYLDMVFLRHKHPPGLATASVTQEHLNFILTTKDPQNECVQNIFHLEQPVQ